MKIETYINNEVKKYRNKTINNKKKGVNLDKLESMKRQHERNCEDFISKQNLMYYEECEYKDMAREKLEGVDEELFGCFNNKGVCLGYDFYR